MFRYASYVVILSCLTAIVALLTAYGGPMHFSLAPAYGQAPPKYTGFRSCGDGASCHDRTKVKAEYPLMNESSFWFEEDKHAGAYETLSGKAHERTKGKKLPRAKKQTLAEYGKKSTEIAKKLNITNPADSDRCLNCHAVSVPAALRMEKFDIRDGVQCDACHGPAERWLTPHAKADWTHEKSVAVGMYDTKNLRLRAEKCVSCHLQIDSALVTAGHPDLQAFELDTFSTGMPPHWRDKGALFGVRAWSIGQLVSLRESVIQLKKRAEGNADQDLLAAALKRADGHAVVVRPLLTVAAPNAASLDELSSLSMGDRSAIIAVSTRIENAMNALLNQKAVSERDFDKVSTERLIQAIAGNGDAMARVGLRGAEQGARALDRLYAAYTNVNAAQKNTLNPILDKIFATLAPNRVDATAFAREVKAFQQAFKP